MTLYTIVLVLTSSRVNRAGKDFLTWTGRGLGLSTHSTSTLPQTAQWTVNSRRAIHSSDPNPNILTHVVGRTRMLSRKIRLHVYGRRRTSCLRVRLGHTLEATGEPENTQTGSSTLLGPNKGTGKVQAIYNVQIRGL